jgi:UDP-N-acetyl-D-galactosamine dehydrogenase
VGVLGVTFKENCPDIRNSKVVDLIHELQAWGVTVVMADPWADAAEFSHEYGLTLGTVDAKHPVDCIGSCGWAP